MSCLARLLLENSLFNQLQSNITYIPRKAVALWLHLLRLNPVSKMISSVQLCLQHFTLHFVIFSREKYASKQLCLSPDNAEQWWHDWPTTCSQSPPRFVRQADSANVSSLCTILSMLSQQSAFSLRTRYDPECYEVKKKVVGMSVCMRIKDAVQRAFGYHCWFSQQRAQPPSKC